MENTDPRVDAYIQQAEAFAQPILNHLRQLVHQACPEATETLKWGMPHFEYKGMLCHMAAFKKHCAFGFWKAALLSDPANLFGENAGAGMGHLGQIKSLADLPADEVLLTYIREAVELNKNEVKLPSRAKTPQNRELEIPQYLLEALGTNQDAKQVFENFSYTNKKEYITWLADAKTEATRNNRLATALEWIAEGKSRNWKYEKK